METLFVTAERDIAALLVPKAPREKKHAERLSNCRWTGNYVHTWTGNYVRLSVNLHSPYARCGGNFADCDQVAILVCGDQTFVGGSDEGSAVDIARIRPRRGGYNPKECRVRIINNR